MGCVSRFNDFEDRYNCLKEPTHRIAHFFEGHPTTYKIVLIINHLFRAAMMVGLMYIPHVPLMVSTCICFVGSLFYRLTVEKNCAYKFALPAFAGAVAFMFALPAMISMMNGGAFVSLAGGVTCLGSLVPLAAYATYVVLTVDYNVDKILGHLPLPDYSKTSAENMV